MKPNIKQIEENVENFRAVQYRMRNEGIDYCFEHYSSFDEIEDEEFHKLRNEFLESMKKYVHTLKAKLKHCQNRLTTQHGETIKTNYCFSSVNFC